MRRRGANLRLVAVVVGATAGVLAAGAQAAPAPGTLELCVSRLNGMYDVPFQLSINGGAPITVPGGRCSGPLTTAPGTVTIAESDRNGAAAQIASASVTPSSRNLGLTGSTQKVAVAEGSTSANETKVTFVNEPPGGSTGDLKICKTTGTPGYVGQSFTFHVNGGPAISTPANDGNAPSGSWACTPAGTFRVGTLVTVDEDIPAGGHVERVDANPSGALVGDPDLPTGVAQYLVGAGTTIALYDNEALPPGQGGTIEVCKFGWDPVTGKRDDSLVAGRTFLFTVDDGLTRQTVTVAGGACTDGIVVASGVVRVTAVPDQGYTLDHVDANPSGRVTNSNVLNGWADFEVPAGDDTGAFFFNTHLVGRLKVCNRLTAAGPLNNTPVTFTLTDITDPLHPAPFGMFTVPVPTGATAQCTAPVSVTAGTVLSIKADTSDTGIKATCDSPVTVIANATTEIGCSNAAVGRIEICKALGANAKGIKFARRFFFRIDGGAQIPLTVSPGASGLPCTLPQVVAAGPHSVGEDSKSCTVKPPTSMSGPTCTPDDDFVLTGIDVNPAVAVHPGTAPSLASRSVVVEVPYGSDEVEVTFENQIRTALVKVCKTVTSAGTGKVFHFNLNGAPVTVDLNAGPCTPYPYPIPVLQPDGSHTAVSLSEVSRDPDGKQPVDYTGLPPSTGDYYVSNLVWQGIRAGTTPMTNCKPGPGDPPVWYSPTGKHCSFFTAITKVHIRWELGGGNAPAGPNGTISPNVNTITFTNSPGGGP